MSPFEFSVLTWKGVEQGLSIHAAYMKCCYHGPHGNKASAESEGLMRVPAKIYQPLQAQP